MQTRSTSRPARRAPMRALVFCVLLIGLHATASRAQEVTLNLRDVDIQSFIDSVSEITGKTFVVEPRVKGNVTVIAHEAMSADAVYSVFLAVLEVYGYAAVQSGGVVKILPDVTAKQNSVRTLGEQPDGPREELVSQVIQVDNVPAAQLVPILRPLVPQDAHLAAFTPSNILVLTDRVGNIERMMEIIERIDRSTEGAIDVVPLQHASASEVVRIINALSPQGGQNARGQTGPLLAADERTNSVLISGERADRLEIRALVANLDTPLERTGNTRVVYLRYANAADLVPILEGVNQTSQDTQAQGGASGNRSRTTEVDIQADEATNALIITAPPDVQRNLRAVVRRLDIRRAQVLVEAIIAEIFEDRARELGFEFIYDGSSDGSGPLGGSVFRTQDVLAAAIENPLSLARTGLNLAVGEFDGDGFDFGVLLQALKSDAYTNILSTPSILTLDNEEAEINVGQNVPFVTGSFTSTGSGTTPDNPFQTIERQDVGVTLKVTPQINEGNAVRLALEQEVSSIASSAVSAADIITNTRSIKTNVLVEDNQILVLGGLIDDTLNDSEQKVPGLGDLPVLGNLFKSRSSTRGKRNLMVFIHPRIMRTPGTAGELTAEKYNYIRTRQLIARNQNSGLFRTEEPTLLPDLDSLLLNPPVPDDGVAGRAGGAGMGGDSMSLHSGPVLPAWQQ